MFYGFVTFSSLKMRKKDYVTYQKVSFQFLVLADSPRVPLRISGKQNSLFPHTDSYQEFRVNQPLCNLYDARENSRIQNIGVA